MAYMRQLSGVMVLLEGDELDDRAMLRERREVEARYIEAAADDPWTPPPDGQTPWAGTCGGDRQSDG